MPYMDMEQLERGVEDATKFMEFHGVDDLVREYELKALANEDYQTFPVETVKFSVGYMIALWHHIHDAKLWLPEIRKAMDDHCEVRNVIKSKGSDREKYSEICKIMNPEGDNLWEEDEIG
tara:strand:- start:55 stop:414 length:360 start_codon:yes stop_codon:yes gene_type:complete